MLIVNAQVVSAINEKRLIEFVYKDGRARVVEPHDYGVRGGVAKILAYQIGGASRSGTPHGWKWYDVDDMRQLTLLERHSRVRAQTATSVTSDGMCSSPA